MVTLIARQSIIIKCKLQESIMLGNYEFYYAAGLISKLTGKSFDFEISPQEMFAQAAKAAEEYQTEDEKEKYLIQMLLNFKPDEQKDDQMRELFEWGKKEEKMWIE